MSLSKLEAPSTRPMAAAPLPATKLTVNTPAVRMPAIKIKWVCLLCAIAAHGLLLRLPVNSPQSAPPPTPAPEASAPTVAVVPLPPAPAALDPVPEPAPALDASAAVLPAPAPAQSTARPTAAPAPAAPPDTPPPPPEPPPPPAPPEAAGAYADFPHPEAATADCSGQQADCWRLPAENWQATARSLKSQLESQNYTLKNITDEVLNNDTGARIFEVRQQDQVVHYLNVVSIASGALYTLTPAPMTDAEIAALQPLSQ